MKYRSDVDGLRAVAIIPVVMYHAAAFTAPGGFVGVDIFFVISGFLITRIISKEIDERKFSLITFYLRRARRIFPALFAMLAVISAAAIVLMAPSQLKEYGRTALSTAIFLSNIKFYHLSGYFDGDADLKPLLHTWSLAVEEQFYIVFPLILLLLARAPRTLKILVVAILAVISLVISQWLLFRDMSAAFYLSHSRAFELMIGSLLGLGAFPAIKSRFTAEALGATGAALILAAIMLFRGDMHFPGLAALVPCCGAALLIHSGDQHETFASRALSLRPARFVGSISYSLYLWHWPLLVLARQATLGPPSPALIAGMVVASVAMATLSRQFIEQPCLRARGVKPIPAFAMAGAAMFAISLFGWSAGATSGFPGRFPAQAQRLFAGASDSSPERPRCHDGAARDGIPYGENCIFGARGAAPTIAIWGDSHGAELSIAMGEAAAREHAAIMQITSSACPPSVGYKSSERPKCTLHNDMTLPALERDGRIRHVVMIAHYEAYPPAMLDGFEAAARRLAAAGKALTIVYPVPTFGFDVPIALGLTAARHDGSTFDTSYSAYRSWNADTIRRLDLLSRATHAQQVRPDLTLCQAGRCRAADAGGPLYFDDDHLSLHGARRLVAASPLGSLFRPAAGGRDQQQAQSSRRDALASPGSPSH